LQVESIFGDQRQVLPLEVAARFLVMRLDPQRAVVVDDACRQTEEQAGNGNHGQAAAGRQPQETDRRAGKGQGNPPRRQVVDGLAPFAGQEIRRRAGGVEEEQVKGLDRHLHCRQQGQQRQRLPLTAGQAGDTPGGEEHHRHMEQGAGQTLFRKHAVRSDAKQRLDDGQDDAERRQGDERCPRR